MQLVQSYLWSLLLCLIFSFEPCVSYYVNSFFYSPMIKSSFTKRITTQGISTRARYIEKGGRPSFTFQASTLQDKDKEKYEQNKGVGVNFNNNEDFTHLRNMEQDRPNWANEDSIISSFISSLINNKFLYSLMKLGARQVLISTAEKNGVAWTKEAERLMNTERLKEIFDIKYKASHKKFLSQSLYPDYYLNPFHAYEDGNLNWLAAAEVESATKSMCLRAWPNIPDLTPESASKKLRDGYLKALQNYINYYTGGRNKIENVVDIGCSAGISTTALQKYFNENIRNCIGLDLSPYFLSVASYNEEQNPLGIDYIHAKAEETTLANNSQDVAMLTFVVHELPQIPTETIYQEMYRILKKDGVIAITDNDPRSRVIQQLPKPVATLMKSTEPFSDQYYAMNMESTLAKIGFVDIETIASDMRHRTIYARKP